MTTLLFTMAIVALAMTGLAVGVMLGGRCMLGGCARHGKDTSACACRDGQDPAPPPP